jgi:hypothetical protein
LREAPVANVKGKEKPVQTFVPVVERDRDEAK